MNKFFLVFILTFMIMTCAYCNETSNKKQNKFFSIAWLIRDFPGNTEPYGHWINSETNFEGLERASAIMDKCIQKARKKRPDLPEYMPQNIGLYNVPTKKEYGDFVKDRLAKGSEIGYANAVFDNRKAEIEEYFNLPKGSINAWVGSWELEEEPWITKSAVDNNIKVQFNAVLEGDSLIGETIDLGHNWEGRPFMPYYTQIRLDKPNMSSKSNRELREKNAPLDLFWLTRTPWSEYDRHCFQYSFHLGDVRVGGGQYLRCTPDNIWFWKNEISEWQKNLDKKYIPYAHISICLEGELTGKGVDANQIGENGRDGNLAMLEKLIDYLLENGWTPLTGIEFYDWYSNKWPSPETPNTVVFFKDTARDPNGKYNTPNWSIPESESFDMGNILIAETKYFRVIDHEHRLSPFMEVAYELETPNLFQTGYAGHDPREDIIDELHGGATFADGTGFIGDPKQLSVTAATGNALFWGNDPHRGIPTKWDVMASKLGVMPMTKNRCYTVLIDGKDIQFPTKWEPNKYYGKIFDIVRNDKYISWKKRIKFDFNGKNATLVMSHKLEGKEHKIRIIDENNMFKNNKIEFAFRPFFYPGWLLEQEYLVYGNVSGMDKPFGYKIDNKEDVIQKVSIGKERILSLYHENNNVPEMNRMVEVILPKGTRNVKFIDKAGSNQYVEATAEMSYFPAEITLRYKRLNPID